jgi:hypothetical protein
MPAIDWKDPTNINIQNVIPGSHGKLNATGIPTATVEVLSVVANTVSDVTHSSSARALLGWAVLRAGLSCDQGSHTLITLSLTAFVANNLSHWYQNGAEKGETRYHCSNDITGVGTTCVYIAREDRALTIALLYPPAPI